ncbi:MAG: hypothetical protein HY646_00265 [Acidobacteria bacterium]|nr:hypothetical protein [Acidobacteriota bacterium]
MSATLISLLVVEVILTAAAIVLFVYRSMLDMKEEDHIIIDEAESHLARDQAVIRQRANALGKYMKVVGIAWCILAVAIFGLWVAEGLNMI